MSIAVKELRRRPAGFLPAGGALTLLVLLLLVLGGFLDGLTLGATGAYRAQEGNLLVFDADSELQLARSRITPDVRDAVAAVDGVAAVGTLGSTATTTAIPGRDQLLDVVVFGYERDTDVLPGPPSDGAAVVDRRLLELADVTEGEVLEVGPEPIEIVVESFVGDVSQGSPTIWVDPATWRRVASSANPAGALPEQVVPVLVVMPATGVDLQELADRVEGTADVDAVTATEAIDALPVVTQQATTFQGIIAVTFVVTLIVVALFFALLTLERERLYAVLKAVGASTGELVSGVAAQALLIALGALVVGGALAAGLVAVLPVELPVQLEPGRMVQVAVGTVITALLGGLFTLRRLLRIDPATAIG